MYTVTWRFNDRLHVTSFDSIITAMREYYRLQDAGMYPSIHIR